MLVRGHQAHEGEDDEAGAVHSSGLGSKGDSGFAGIAFSILLGKSYHTVCMYIGCPRRCIGPLLLVWYLQFRTLARPTYGCGPKIV
jgi:hypothetical protein